MPLPLLLPLLLAGGIGVTSAARSSKRKVRQAGLPSWDSVHFSPADLTEEEAVPEMALRNMNLLAAGVLDPIADSLGAWNPDPSDGYDPDSDGWQATGLTTSIPTEPGNAGKLARAIFEESGRLPIMAISYNETEGLVHILAHPTGLAGHCTITHPSGATDEMKDGDSVPEAVQAGAMVDLPADDTEGQEEVAFTGETLS